MSDRRQQRAAARTIALLAAVCMVACNGLTGIGELGMGAPDDDQGTDPNITGGPPNTDAPPPSSTALDASAQDAATDRGGGATMDQATQDAPVDSAPPVDTGPCVPTSVGPRYGSDATAPQGTWSTRTGILAPDTNPAHSNGNHMSAIVTSGYGFALPASAQIKGIKVDIARTAYGSVSDTAITLPKGASKANGAWPDGLHTGPYVTAVYGGSTDLWGAPWTAGDINQTSFGVSITVSGDGDGHADSVGVTVYYCP